MSMVQGAVHLSSSSFASYHLLFAGFNLNGCFYKEECFYGCLLLPLTTDGPTHKEKYLLHKGANSFVEEDPQMKCKTNSWQVITVP